jgi:peptidoglycan/LPS O-acetylase OafA/YrhL
MSNDLVIADSRGTDRPRASARVPGIDVLRGLCILAVIFLHFNLRIGIEQSAFGLSFPLATKLLVWNGYYGVKIFFVVSGFLITGWSLRRWGHLSHMSVSHFYWMRFARIAPCLLALLVLLSVLHRAGVPHFTIDTQRSSLGRALFAAMTFHVNWLEAQVGYLPGTWDALWSLSVEEAFYVFFPLICKLVRRERLLVLVFGVFGILGPFARTVLSDNEQWRDKGYLSCMDGIALGCLAAILAERAAFGSNARWWLRICGITLSLFVIVCKSAVAWLGWYKLGLDDTMLSFGAALLLVGLDRIKRGAGAPRRLTAPLRWLGRNSYEVYLTHMFVVFPVVALFYRWHQGLNIALLWFLAAAGLAGVVGYGVARFYSEPLNRRIRDAFRPPASADAARN